MLIISGNRYKTIVRCPKTDMRLLGDPGEFTILLDSEDEVEFYCPACGKRHRVNRSKIEMVTIPEGF